MPRPSGQWAMPIRTISCGGIPTSDFPSYVTSPAEGRTMPEIARSVVVLPAPLQPMSETICPR